MLNWAQMALERGGIEYNNFKNVIFEHMLWINLMSTLSKIDLKWMTEMVIQQCFR